MSDDLVEKAARAMAELNGWPDDLYYEWGGEALVVIPIIAAEMRERAMHAVRVCASLDENGYICEKSEAMKAIRALPLEPPK
jgi:hypothetical protein